MKNLTQSQIWQAQTEAIGRMAREACQYGEKKYYCHCQCHYNGTLLHGCQSKCFYCEGRPGDGNELFYKIEEPEKSCACHNGCDCGGNQICKIDNCNICSNKEKQGWEEEFDIRWGSDLYRHWNHNDSWITCGEEVKSFIHSLLFQEKQELLRDIKNWTKGKTVTKDKLREYINKLI